MLVGATSSNGFQTMDLATANMVKVYKQCEAVPHGTVHNSHGIMIAQRGRPLLHQYGKKEAPLKKLPLIEAPTTLVSSPTGKLLAMGAASGKIYLWSLETGSLIFAQDVHFQAVTGLAFSDDSAALVSCSKDSRVLIWSVADLLTGRGNPVDPKHSLSDHTLAVTGLWLGKGSFKEAVLYTVSEDATICVYSVGTGRLLHTLTLGQKINTIIGDPLERALYLGTDSGVSIVGLYTVKPAGTQLESIFTAGSVIDVENSPRIGTGSITALALVPDATLLLVGDSEGDINGWDVGSRQVVRKFKQIKGSVSDLFLLAEIGDDVDPIPLLQRTIDQQINDLELTTPSFAVSPSDPLFQVSNVEIDAIANASAASTSNPSNGTADSARALEASEAKYKDLKRVYDDLWKQYLEAKGHN